MGDCVEGTADNVPQGAADRSAEEENDTFNEESLYEEGPLSGWEGGMMRYVVYVTLEAQYFNAESATTSYKRAVPSPGTPFSAGNVCGRNNPGTKMTSPMTPTLWGSMIAVVVKDRETVTFRQYPNDNLLDSVQSLGTEYKTGLCLKATPQEPFIIGGKSRQMGKGQRILWRKGDTSNTSPIEGAVDGYQLLIL